MKSLLLLISLLSMLFVSFSPRSTHRADSIYFDESVPEVMKLGNSYYEVGLRKSNGGILYITDKNTGDNLTEGNLNGCLWVIIFDYDPPADFFESCQFWAEGTDRFTYTWSPLNNQLTLNYIPDPGAIKTVAAAVSITAYADNAFDLQLNITNHWGKRTEDIKFPSNLVFIKGDIHSALLPVLPGLLLTPEFFNQTSGGIEYKYPGWPGGFSDYLSISTSTGSLAMYANYGEEPLAPLKFGFYFDNCAGLYSTCYTHNYIAAVADGATWSSPILRMRTSGSHDDLISHFREDNGITFLPDLVAKLGENYQTMTRLPLYKADTEQLATRFDEYDTIFSQIQYPGLLHVMGYQPNGFDAYNPDFLPPDGKWGTTEDMAAMFALAQSKGYLVMPYINPTWWDEGSPTLLTLEPPLTKSDIAALNETGTPYYEDYGCPDDCHYGYVVCPYSAFVQLTLSDLMTQMKTELPSDFIFEDQVGARDTKFDYNTASPIPEAFSQGWVNHAEQYANQGLMTECGFDRLIPHEIGFHGSVLLLDVLNAMDGNLYDGTWEYYPFATMLARNKTLFYQHDLEPRSFTHNKRNLLVNLAMGYMLSYDLNQSEWGGGYDAEWIRVPAEFQRFVLSRYASETLTGYMNIAEDVTQTDFENYHVVSNWSNVSTYSVDGHILSRQGTLVWNDDNNLRAGVFIQYNGQSLSSGDHFLIEERSADQIIIRQPLGNDTPLTVVPLPEWGDQQCVLALAYTHDERLVGAVPVSVQTGALMFSYTRMLHGQEVAYYRLVEGESSLYLPIIFK